jgi:hypothetical protein
MGETDEREALLRDMRRSRLSRASFTAAVGPGRPSVIGIADVIAEEEREELEDEFPDLY